MNQANTVKFHYLDHSMYIKTGLLLRSSYFGPKHLILLNLSWPNPLFYSNT